MRGRRQRTRRCARKAHGVVHPEHGLTERGHRGASNDPDDAAGQRGLAVEPGQRNAAHRSIRNERHPRGDDARATATAGPFTGRTKRTGDVVAGGCLGRLRRPLPRRAFVFGPHPVVVDPKTRFGEPKRHGGACAPAGKRGRSKHALEACVRGHAPHGTGCDVRRSASIGTDPDVHRERPIGQARGGVTAEHRDARDRSAGRGLQGRPWRCSEDGAAHGRRRFGCAKDFVLRCRGLHPQRARQQRTPPKQRVHGRTITDARSLDPPRGLP